MAAERCQCAPQARQIRSYVLRSPGQTSLRIPPDPEETHRAVRRARPTSRGTSRVSAGRCGPRRHQTSGTWPDGYEVGAKNHDSMA